jgi:hypothetical protein|tara:strand:- start:479 stop:613 length:135 start_codon:yes stop_codon:yes gene_type:complete
MPELYAGGDGVSLVAVGFFFHWTFWNRAYGRSGYWGYLLRASTD